MPPRKERAVKKQAQVAQCTAQTWVWPREEQNSHQAEIQKEKQKDWAEKQQQFSESWEVIQGTAFTFSFN